MKPAQTIYLVDDDSLMVKLYSSVFQTYNFNIKTFQDPRIGLEECVKNTPSLLLLDLKMPFMDGFDFLAKLRANGTTKDLPVIVLTNFSGTEERERAGKFGITDYVVKSDASPEELVGKIKRVLA